MTGMTFGRDDATLLRWGGIAALILALAYLVITGLYVASGAVPTGGDGQAWLTYLAGKSTAWWGILGLSVLTDVLFFPVAAALFVALRAIDRNLALAGSGLLALFALLDLAVTWPNYASLVSLANMPEGAGRAADAFTVAAATYAAAVLDSSLFAVYAILVPALGILAISIVMLRGSFGRATAWVGVLTGILGIGAVVGPLVASALGTLAILASVLTLIWVALAGYRLLGMSRTTP
jgi:hypothetical protein